MWEIGVLFLDLLLALDMTLSISVPLFFLLIYFVMYKRDIFIGNVSAPPAAHLFSKKAGSNVCFSLFKSLYLVEDKVLV